MKKTVACMLMLLIMGIALTGCKHNKIKLTSENQTFLYYINGDKTEIETEDYTIAEKDPQKAVDEMVKEMSKKTTEVDYNPAIPDDVEVLSAIVSDGQVQLDLSDGYNQVGSVMQGLCRAAIVDSLVQIDGVEAVRFLVNGVPMTDRHGNEIGALDAESFVQNIGSTLNTYQTATLHLFFANEVGDALHMETKDVKYSSNVSVEKLIMEQLLKGPSDVGNYRTISADTIILGVTIRDGICYVNLDESFLQSGYDIKPEIMIYSIVNSLTDGTTINSVQILVNGESNVQYMDVVDLSQPLTEKTEYITEE
ncbi:MAG: GerMN domain-containing protein [Hespellia sp.]|nr:GerMN domain-containing protein [Hespellia sp.]